MPRAHVDHADRDDGVEAEAEAERDQQGDQRHVLLGHSDGRGSESEQRGHPAHEPQRPMLESMRRPAEARLDRPGATNNAGHAADEEHEEDNASRFRETPGNREQRRRYQPSDLSKRGGWPLLFRRVDEGEGPREHGPPVALELAGGKDPGRGLRQDDDAEH